MNDRISGADRSRKSRDADEAKERIWMTFEAIYREYGDKIMNLAYRMTGSKESARDMTQEIFIKVYENMDSFRGDSQVFTWLYRIATNHIFNFLKKERRRKWLNLMDKPLSEVLQEDQIDPLFWSRSAPQPDRQMEKSEREKRVWQSIQQLSPKYRVPLVLNRYEDMSYQEIAETMQLSLSAVESRIHRAKKELVKLLEPYIKDL
ncbi:MAG: sigma-70 family RNA polymerase sigma factor [Calditrichaeota bacterium]|nr:sigma-70 family RNA polymerase sigma factor [Calditrichota bacterium]MCB0267637.1 sigma-70 family RNA polymerase sigma factor [Calditrichota bacterium]MCB0301732.1 sigma-70 family RNA polymerase sigma factor [Calditrichota bacterium]